MFSSLTMLFSTLLSWLVLIVATIFALYVLVMAFLQVTGRTFAASEPTKKARGSGNSGSPRK